MYTQRIVVTFVLLVLFGGTIIESSQSVTASVAIHDVKLEPMSFSTSVASQYQNITYEGDLLVSNNETFSIQDSEFCMIGNITVQDTSTLIIQNSKFTLHSPSIVLQHQAKLIMTNATLISRNPYNYWGGIVVHDDSEANISYSTLQEWWEVQASDNSKIHVNNSTITSGDYYHPSGIGTHGTSSVVIENSTIDEVWIWNNSTVSINNSVVRLVRAGGATNVNIADSEIGAIETMGSPTFSVQHTKVAWRANFLYNSSVRFTSSSVAEVIARGNANILLIDSYAGSIETHDDATVSVGWHLPLFGLVTMHYTWVPIVQMIIVIAIIVVIITVLVFLYRKRARQIQREHAPVPGSRENLSINYSSIM